MGASEKARNKVDRLAGRAREAFGRATGDRRLESQGRRQQVTSNLKDAGEKIKDAFRPRRAPRRDYRGY